jgi:hypothetical protein
MFGGEKAIHNAINNVYDDHNHHPIIKSQYDFAIVDESKPANTSNNGEITNEPLSVIAVDDPVICEIYVQDSDLACLNNIPCTYHEEDNLPHAILTSELDWDPYIWYHDFEPGDQWSEISFIDTKFDDASDYKNRDLLELEELLESNANSSHGSNGNLRPKDNAIAPDDRRDKNKGENSTALNPC